MTSSKRLVRGSLSANCQFVVVLGHPQLDYAAGPDLGPDFVETLVVFDRLVFDREPRLVV